MEKGLSTFASEMASSAMILGKYLGNSSNLVLIGSEGIASSDSLILIDELGRGTSPSEGIGISHAIAERLIKLKVSSRSYLDVCRTFSSFQAFVFFAT